MIGFFIAIATVVLLIVLICYISIEIYALNRVFGDIEEVPQREYFLVLGTGPTRKDGHPNRYFTYRMDAAAALYHRRKVSRFILSGDKHEDYDEPAAMQNALAERSIPAEACILDGKGFDTIDSILHARDLSGCNSYIIVSQDFHCERAVFLAGSLGVKAIAFTADEVEPFWKSKTKVREIRPV